MQTTKNSNWSELNDPQIVNWKRVRLAIEHENTLTNARMTWLLSAQGFLLAAYMLVFTSSTKKDFEPSHFQEIQWVLLAIVIAGALISFFLFRGIKAAHDQHTRLKKWWYKQIDKDDPSHPPICGYEPQFLLTIEYYKFPLIFLPIWLILAFTPFMSDIAKNKQNVLDELSHAAPYIAGMVILTLVGFLLGRAQLKDKSDI